MSAVLEIAHVLKILRANVTDGTLEPLERPPTHRVLEMGNALGNAIIQKF